QSPRRKQLMEMAELAFEVVVADVDETNPPGMPGHEVPAFLAQKKARAIQERGHEGLIIAADTVVLCDEEILGKPIDELDARAILSKLSGRKHEVVTGVCMLEGERERVFSVMTAVFFRPLTDAQIEHYVTRYKPYDKAGAYAIQEWIGVTGIEKIEGDYYNVMGLPIGTLLEELKQF
ncbi:MAG: septum formation protein Maf, partial [Chitinophagia bacterium]|nr:septum formation protein Maf [Chitinophagia bacterium]